MRASTRAVAEQNGRRAEGLAALWLMLKGYRIIARRARTTMGEIDLIARKGRVLAIVEVKARTSQPLGPDIVGPQQRRRIERAALAWVASRVWARTLAIRFDIMAASPGRLPRHFRDAWRPERDLLSGAQ